MSFLFLILSSSTVAQTANSVDQLDPEMIREKFIHSSELPDGVSYRNILNVVKGMHDEDPTMAVYWIKSSMNTDLSQAEALVEVLLEAGRTLRERNNDAIRARACSHGIPVVTGEDVYSVFEEIDDLSDDVAWESLQDLKRDLGDEMAAGLDQWVQAQKQNIVHVKMNHKNAYQASGESVDARIAAICTRNPGGGVQ